MPTRNELAGARSYDRFKEFQGKRYTGMQIGRGHKWRYDAGDWSEKKVTPDKWEFDYAVTKRRKGRAPEGSGAPVGTSHRWYVLAEQVVTKLDANSYSTAMKGVKYKLNHKRADKETWSASDRAQRKKLIELLRDAIAELEREPAEVQPAPPGERRPAAHRARSREDARVSAAGTRPARRASSPASRSRTAAGRKSGRSRR
jgi:hypothetical protein